MFHYKSVYVLFNPSRRNSVHSVRVRSFFYFRFFVFFHFSRIYISRYVPYVHLCFSRSVERNDEDLAASVERRRFCRDNVVVVVVVVIFFFFFFFWRTIDWNDISMWLGRLVPELIELYLTDLYVRDVEASGRCGEHSEVRGQGTCPRPRNQAKAGLHPFHAFYPAWRPRWSVLYWYF